MKKLWEKYVSLLLCVCTITGTAVIDAAAINNQAFELERIDDFATLIDVLHQHPEVFDEYFITPVSVEEVKQGIAEGKPYYILDKETKARAFLGSLNAKRRFTNQQQMDALVAGENSLQLSEEIAPIARNVSYGAAWPFWATSSGEVNCYGYALGVIYDYSPGPNLYESATLKEMQDYIGIDLKNLFGGTAREIASHLASINDNEWRIAFRTGSGYVCLDGEWFDLWDFHFMVQTSTGEWAHKQGTINPSERLGYIIPHGEQWSFTDDYSKIVNFYNSPTVYMAWSHVYHP